MESYFQIFQIPDSRKSVFGPGDVFTCFHVHKFTDLFTILQMFYNFSPMFHKSFSYEPSRQYGISLQYEQDGELMTILPNMLCAELRSAGVAIDQELQPAEKPVTRKILSFDSGSAELEEGEIVQPTTEAKIPAESTEVAAMLSEATTQMELEHKGQLVSQQKAFDEQVQVFTQRSAELEKRIESRVGAVEHKLGSFDIQFHQMQQMQIGQSQRSPRKRSTVGAALQPNNTNSQQPGGGRQTQMPQDPAVMEAMMMQQSLEQKMTAAIPCSLTP